MKSPETGPPYPFHPWLFAVAPALLLYAENAGNLTPSQLLLPGLLSLAATALLLAGTRAATGAHSSAAALSSAVLVAFWSRGHLTGAVGSWVAGDVARVATGLLTVLLLAALAFQLRSRPPAAVVTRLLNAGALALVVLPLGRVLLSAAASTTAPTTPPSPVASPVRLPDRQPGKRLPDVFFVVLDAYGSPRFLSHRYGIDLGPFKRALRDRGFFVAEDARANYPLTEYSLASILNFDHIGSLVGARRAGDQDRGPIRASIDRSCVIASFRSAGYRVVTFPSGYRSAELATADEIRMPVFAPSEFHGLLLETTALPELLRAAGFSDGDLPFDLHRTHVKYTLTKFPDAAGRIRPSFVLAHAVAPHTPFVLDSRGEATRSPWPFTLWDGSELFRRVPQARDRYVEAYGQQVIGLNAILLPSLDRLLASTRGEVVILLIGDHGPRFGTDWTSAERTDLDEAYSAFLAAYWPSRSYAALGRVRTLVNVFPALFEGAFGVPVAFQDDRSFFAPYEDPYALRDVTAPLRAARARRNAEP